MRQHLSNLLRSPLGLMLIAFLLALTLVLVEVRLQVAAYWETHPEQWRIMREFAANDPGSVDFLAERQAESQKVLVARQTARDAEEALASECKANAPSMPRLTRFLCDLPELLAKDAARWQALTPAQRVAERAANEAATKAEIEKKKTP
jgi:hypothetical protein